MLGWLPGCEPHSQQRPPPPLRPHLNECSRGGGEGPKVRPSPHCWGATCGSRWWGWSPSLSADAFCPGPGGLRSFPSRLHSGRVFSVWARALFLYRPSHFKEAELPPPSPIPSSCFLLLFLDSLVPSLRGPTRCREKRAVPFVSNWCRALIRRASEWHAHSVI